MKKQIHFKKLWLLILILICVHFVAGCNSQTEDSSDVDTSEQTLWRLLDESGEIAAYLSETDSDVLEISQLISTHIACVDNRSASNVNFSEESQTYSPEFLESLLFSDYDTKLEALYQNNDLAISSTTVIWNPNTISDGRTSCKVDIDSVFQFVAGTNEYLDALGVELNTNYIEHRIYYCEKIDGVWKITNIEKSALYQ